MTSIAKYLFHVVHVRIISYLLSNTSLEVMVFCQAYLINPKTHGYF
jgi:hypothetical protein